MGRVKKQLNIKYPIYGSGGGMGYADEYIFAGFVELFGDPKTNPNGYPLREFLEYIDFLTSGSRRWAKYCVDEGKESKGFFDVC